MHNLNLFMVYSGKFYQILLSGTHQNQEYQSIPFNQATPYLYPNLMEQWPGKEEAAELVDSDRRDLRLVWPAQQFQI